MQLPREGGSSRSSSRGSGHHTLPLGEGPTREDHLRPVVGEVRLHPIVVGVRPVTKIAAEVTGIIGTTETAEVMGEEAPAPPRVVAVVTGTLTARPSEIGGHGDAGEVEGGMRMNPFIIF